MNTPDLSRRLAALLWVAIGFMVFSRLGAVLLTDVKPASDMAWYYERAVELMKTGHYAEGGVPTAYWPIGYPAFLAGLMSVFGASVMVGQLGNVVLSLLSALFIYRICMKWWSDPTIAAIAVCLYAVYPNQIGYSVGLYSEPLFVVLFLGILLLVSPEASTRRLVAAGVLAGLATLVKTQMLLLGPLLMFVLSLGDWRRPSWLHALRQAVVGALLMGLVIAPWTWRNHVTFDAFIPVSTNGGMSLLAGNNPAMTTDLRTDYAEDPATFKRVGFSVRDQVAADTRARQAAKDWIFEHPTTFLALMPKKLFRFWVPDGESEWALQQGLASYDRWKNSIRTVRIVNQFYYLALLGAFAWALRRCLRFRDPRTLVAPMIMAFFTALSLVFSGQSRYHAPLMPLVVAYAAWAIVSLSPAARRVGSAPMSMASQPQNGA